MSDCFWLNLFLILSEALKQFSYILMMEQYTKIIMYIIEFVSEFN